MWKFCGIVQFSQSFGRIARNFAQIVPFHKISAAGNQVKFRCLTQWTSSLLLILPVLPFMLMGRGNSTILVWKKLLLKSEIYLVDPLFYKTCRCRCYDRCIPGNFWKFKIQVHCRAVFRTLPCICANFFKKIVKYTYRETLDPAQD